MIDNVELREFIEDIKSHLEYVLGETQYMQNKINELEGDSDLFRKLEFYLTPNINHWINGIQAGNIKDLESLEESRTEAAREEVRKSIAAQKKIDKKK